MYKTWIHSHVIYPNTQVEVWLTDFIQFNILFIRLDFDSFVSDWLNQWPYVSQEHWSYYSYPI